MPLTPIEIHSKEFAKSFRGYDEDEVNAFLNQIIKDYEHFIKEREDANAKLEDMQQKVDKFVGIKDSLNKSISVAQSAAENLKKNAQAEAALIVKEAEKNADRIVNESLAKANKVSLEIEELKNQSRLYRSKLRLLVESQLRMLSGDEVEDPDVSLDSVHAELETSDISTTIQSEEDIVADTLSQMDAVLNDSYDVDTSIDHVSLDTDDYFDFDIDHTSASKASDVAVDHDNVAEQKNIPPDDDANELDKLSNLVASLRDDNEEEQVVQKKKSRFRTKKSF